jgi:hypothetical protein
MLNRLISNIPQLEIKYKQNYNFVCCLYGCEPCSLTQKEKHRLRLFENDTLRRTFGPKKDKVTGD